MPQSPSFGNGMRKGEHNLYSRGCGQGFKWNVGNLVVSGRHVAITLPVLVVAYLPLCHSALPQYMPLAGLCAMFLRLRIAGPAVYVATSLQSGAQASQWLGATTVPVWGVKQYPVHTRTIMSLNYPQTPSDALRLNKPQPSPRQLHRAGRML